MSRADPRLPQKVTLDPKEPSKWVRNYDSSPKRGKIYEVPNAVFVDIGPPGQSFWNLNDTSSLGGYSGMIELANSKAQVQRTPAISPSGIKAHFEEPAIWGYIFAGHGSKGALGAVGGSVGPSVPDRHHRIGLLNLFACEMGSIALGQTYSGGGSVWLYNVAPGGEFLYFPWLAWHWSKPSRWDW